MASSGKRKTTMAKLNRERRLLERRHEKAARKDARKRAAALELESPSHTLTEIAPPGDGEIPADDDLEVGPPPQDQRLPSP